MDFGVLTRDSGRPKEDHANSLRVFHGMTDAHALAARAVPRSIKSPGVSGHQHYINRRRNDLPTGKTSPLTFRIELALKEALRAAAQRDCRSIANAVGVLIRDHCDRSGINVQEPNAVSRNERKKGG